MEPSLSFLVVFRASVVMTLIVAVFMSLAWTPVRDSRVQITFWALAIFVHAAWCLVPELGAFTPVARWVAIMWLAAMLTAIVLLIPFAVLTSLCRSLGRVCSPARLAGVYVTCAGLAGVIIACTSTAPFVVRTEDIHISDLPEALDGFRIANLGDVHIGQFIDAKELRRGIDAINAEHVDLLVISGDLVDDVTQLEEAMRALEASNAPNKTIAILGNHEEMGDLPAILSHYRQHTQHITLLVNENIGITVKDASIHIAGVNFPMIRRGDHKQSQRELREAMRAQADLAFMGVSKGDMIVAVSHSPEFFPFAAAHGAQLTLASHTHGAQLRIFGRPIVDLYPFLQGIYRDRLAYLDVSAGFGHWLPIRYGVPREIVIDTLRRGN